MSKLKAICCINATGGVYIVVVLHQKNLMDNKIKHPKDLKQEFEALTQNDYLQFVRFFEKNEASIRHLKTSDVDGEVDFHDRMIENYGICLSYSGYYSKSVGIIDEAIDTLNKKDVDHSSTISEHLLWAKCTSLSQLKRYTESELVCIDLLKIDPSNDKYITTLVNFKNWKKRKLVNKIWLVVVLWFMLDMFIFDKLDSAYQRLTLSGLGLVSLGTVIIMEIQLSVNKKRKYNKK